MTVPRGRFFHVKKDRKESLMPAKAVSTIGTVLKYGASASNLAQLCKIKSYPDLGGRE